MKLDLLNNRGWLNREYHVRCRSMQDIADELGTNKQRIRRALKRLEIPIRSKSEAQKKALESGRASHPTEGTKRSTKVKEKIAESVAQSWADASPEELEHRSNLAKAQWADMEPNQKEALLKNARDAVRVTSKSGSKLEKYLKERLTEAGYDVEYHKMGLIPNVNLEIDLLLPAMYTAIEVDGPSHFFPIWGEDNLQRNMRSDMQKTGLLLHQGLVLIRIAQKSHNLSPLKLRQTASRLLQVLLNIEEKFPKGDKRFIELEV